MAYSRIAKAGTTRRGVVAASLALGLAASAAGADPIAIVAAESVYGDIARQIGGSNVSVKSIQENPDQDPHEFEAAPATARVIADARLVIHNGAGYDAWVGRLLSAARSDSRVLIDVAGLVHRKAGDNPHVWYDLGAVSALAAALGARLARLDPAHAAEYGRGVAAFEASLDPLRSRIAALRARYAGTPVTATEPVFGYMTEALGLAMRNMRFQLAVMNETEPGARTIAAFEDDLRRRAVKVLIYNPQSGQALGERMVSLARRSGVPVVPITETLPPGKTYQQWMASQLDALDRALAEQ